MDPNAKPFVPQGRPLCSYFGREEGGCRYGALCRFLHVALPVERADSGITLEEEEVKPVAALLSVSADIL